MSGRMIVGIDGSKESRSALQWALAEAALRDAHLRVVGVVDTRMQPVVPLARQLETDLIDAMTRQVQDAVNDAKHGDSAIDIEQEVRAGQPASELIQLSDDADLLVVGRRGHSALAGLLMGSVATQVSAQANCPVVVVNEQL